MGLREYNCNEDQLGDFDLESQSLIEFKNEMIQTWEAADDTVFI